MVRDLVTIIDTREKGFDSNGRDTEQILSPASNTKLTQTVITEIEYVPAELRTKLLPLLRTV
jgi:hypothetical protein